MSLKFVKGWPCWWCGRDLGMFPAKRKDLHGKTHDTCWPPCGILEAKK